MLIGGSLDWFITLFPELWNPAADIFAYLVSNYCGLKAETEEEPGFYFIFLRRRGSLHRRCFLDFTAERWAEPSGHCALDRKARSNSGAGRVAGMEVTKLRKRNLLQNFLKPCNPIKHPHSSTLPLPFFPLSPPSVSYFRLVTRSHVSRQRRLGRTLSGYPFSVSAEAKSSRPELRLLCRSSVASGRGEC